jgi:hypothetical protein
MNLINTIKNLHNINEDTAIDKEIAEAAKFQDSLVKKAMKVAKRSSGNFDAAWAKIEKIKKGLADFPIVAKALKLANEGVEQWGDDLNEEELDEGKTPIANAWQKGAKSVKSGDIELVRGNRGVHTIKKKGKAIGDFSLEDDSGLWVVNIKGQRGQLTLDYLDELIPQLKESFEESKPAGYGNTDVKVGDEFEKNKLTLKVIAVSGKKVTVKKKGKKQSLMPITQFDTWTKINESVETDLDSLFEEELREDYFNVQYYNGNKNAVDDKFKNFKTKAEADKYAKRGNSIDRVGGEYKVFKVKGRMESVEEAVSMKNAKGIGFGKKGGYDKYVTLAKKKNAKSHKDVLKVLSREGLGKEELDNVADYVMNALGESVDLDEAVLGGIKKALTSLAKKPEYKKIANALNGLADFGQGSEKKQATAIKNRLTQLARNVGKKESAKLMKIAGLTATYESVDLEEAKGSDCTIQNDGRNNIAVCIDGLSFADARKGTRGSMMNITDFKKKAKVAYADAKGKPTLPAVKKEIKALGAKNFYAKWQADSSSYKDDSVQIWFTK